MYSSFNFIMLFKEFLIFSNVVMQIEWTSVTLDIMFLAYAVMPFQQVHPDICCNLEYFTSIMTEPVHIVIIFQIDQCVTIR